MRHRIFVRTRPCYRRRLRTHRVFYHSGLAGPDWVHPFSHTGNNGWNLQQIVMKKIDFEIRDVLDKPLMAHLSSVEKGEPRDSPLWFLFEDGSIWLFGTEEDSFIRRLRLEPRCAIGVVEFDLEMGLLKHVGVRGTAVVTGVDEDRLNRFVAKYLGPNDWNPWFVKNVVEPINAMVQVIFSSIVAKDVSYFKGGPRIIT